MIQFDFTGDRNKNNLINLDFKEKKQEQTKQST